MSLSFLTNVTQSLTSLVQDESVEVTLELHSTSEGQSNVPLHGSVFEPQEQVQVKLAIKFQQEVQPDAEVTLIAGLCAKHFVSRHW